MKRTLFTLFLLSLLALLSLHGDGWSLTSTSALAQDDSTDQDPEPDFYVPREVQAAYAAGTRSFDGNPGPNYWQNKSVHNIEITVSPPSRTITGTETISYTNNSPYELIYLTLRTYMNVHQANAQRGKPYPPEFITPGIQVDEFAINGNPVDADLVFTPGKTAHIVPLGGPGNGIPPGATVTFDFSWHYELAPADGWKEGVIDDTTFFLAYFYPRLAILNDTPNVYQGWDFEEFTALSGRELANDFADFNFSVNVPKNFVVWATAELQNPDEVLQPAIAARLADSMTSDETITIATPEETQEGQVTAQTDTVTWRWQAENIIEIALGLSDHYQWDAGSVEVDPATGRRASVQAAYDPAATRWATAVQDGKDALAFGSTEWPGVPYPYPKTTLFLGGADEEYPMMANDGPEGPFDGGDGTRFVAAHELLHSWFPWYMGTDERRYPFMDEGWTTAFEYLFNVADLGEARADEIFIEFRSGRLNRLDAGMDIPVIFAADRTAGEVTGNNAYQKGGLGFLALKELMGDEAFKAALHEFIDRWHGKHPLPWDMFNTFNDVSTDITGEDLTWFFNAWFFEPHYLDLALEGVTPNDDGYAVAVRNVGGMPIPFDVVATYADGSSTALRQTPAVWAGEADTITVQIDSTVEPISITLDGGIFLDFDETDNTWNAEATEPMPTSAILAVDVLKNGTYSGIDDEGAVTLTDGLYEGEPFVAGGAARPRVEYIDGSEHIGDLDGDGVGDAAVVLVESSGGSGIFTYIAAQLNQDGQAVDAGAILVGDRTQIAALALADGQIVVGIVTQGPDDAQCCPTRKVRKVYALQDDQLAEVGSEEMGAVAVDDLNGTTWALVALGGEEPSAEGKAPITISFQDEQISGFGGCNRYNSSFTPESENPLAVEVGPVAGTRMACPEPVLTQENAYFSALEHVVQWGYRVGELSLFYINDDGSTGTLLFAHTESEE